MWTEVFSFLESMFSIQVFRTGTEGNDRYGIFVTLKTWRSEKGMGQSRPLEYTIIVNISFDTGLWVFGTYDSVEKVIESHTGTYPMKKETE